MRKHHLFLSALLYLLPALTGFNTVVSQKLPQAVFQKAFRNTSSFIKNVGQYASKVPAAEDMGNVEYGFEGFDMPVVFTNKGMIFFHRKTKGPSEEELERMYKKQVPPEVIASKVKVTYKQVFAEWTGINPAATITAENKTEGNHTYAGVSQQAVSYSRLTISNAYPGIDIVYSIDENNLNGFEYSIIAKPGADLSQVKLVYRGDIKKIRRKSDGRLSVKSDVNEIIQSAPVAYYNDEGTATRKSIQCLFKIAEGVMSFSLPDGYDKTKTLVIDPFVSTTNNLTGTNVSQAKDIDFDYAGNVYVTGGGDGLTYKLSKFNAAGTLQWTFNGTLTTPSWNFGGYYGGWVVDKLTGNVYMSQGFAPGTGFIVVRYNTNGLYDNYISTGNPSFQENWKMIWNCNNGSPRILIAGGGTNANNNLGILTPPSTVLSSINLTNVAGWAQDVADLAIDPVTNNIFTIYGSLFGTPALNGKIFCNPPPYSGTAISWIGNAGFTGVQEAGNRPYLVSAAGGLQDNSANIFAINSAYLFYWDGLNLKAINKASGATVGSPFTVPGNTVMMQGGIIADECNNIFIGSVNGTIKVLNFDGNTFDDAGVPDITVTGFGTKSVYDLAFDETQKILYACGDGFVSSFDVSAYNCAGTVFTLTPTPNCATTSVTTAVNPVPPAGSVITYALYNGATQVANNTTGTFTALQPGTNYTIKATVNQQCSGAQSTVNFTLPGAALNVASVNSTCGNSVGSIAATASLGAAPYTYSIDGVNFQSSGNFAGLASGLYTVYVKDASVCITRSVVNIQNTDGPSLAVTKNDALCGSNTGNVTITGSFGSAPYQYSINGTTFQLNNFFTGMTPGNYTATIKDAAGCKNVLPVVINNIASPAVSAVQQSATCNQPNGSITIFASAGTSPYQYSVNGNNYQPGNVFTNMGTGSYTAYVKDANGCIVTTPVTVSAVAPPTVTVSATIAACANANGSITVTGTGGTLPYSYSIDGNLFQAVSFFGGLTAGVYTVTLKDATGCTVSANITVNSSNGPAASAGSTVSSCSASTGTVTITGTGGTAPYTYSINGTTFQAAALFSALAPGNYIAFVKDALGCQAATAVTVSATAGPSLTASTTPTSCSASTGAVTANASAGVSPYTYSLNGSPFQAGATFSGLSTGNYNLTVKDANNCTKTIPVFVDNVSALHLSASSISASCDGSNLGSITAVATGGSGGLQYSLNGTAYQPASVFTGVAGGSYTVFVKDAGNCVVTAPVTVVISTTVTLTVSVAQNATCGTASGIIRATGGGGVQPLTYNIDGGAYGTNNIFVNVTAAAHTISVKDAANCIVTQTVTVTNSGTGSAPTDVTFTLRGALACTGQTGRIKNLKGVPSGGGNNYTFSLDGAAFTTSNQFTNVAQGLHFVIAKNQNGCTVSKLAPIGLGTPATATAVVTSAPCNTTNGSITITGVGVNTPYHASIDNGISWTTFFPPGANSLTYSGLAPGNYAIIMADDADFTAGPPDIPGACLTTINVVVPSTGGPQINITQQDATCITGTGSITANGSSGTPPYTYSLNGAAFSANNIFSNLLPGAYTVSVKDATNCINGATVNLLIQPAPAFTVTKTDATCRLSNGSITVAASGGTGPYRYSVDGTIFQQGNVFTNLPAGIYTVYAADVNSCYTTSTVIISSIQPPVATAFTLASTCGNSDGSIIVSGSSGSIPYTFSINGTVYQSSTAFSNIPAGFYTINIKDASGCINSTGINLLNSNGPSVTATTTSSACAGSTGTITATGSAGTSPYTYSINGVNFQASGSFTSVANGSYVVTVKDVTGCTGTRAAVVANVNGPAVLTAAITDASCGLANGVITATASGGVGALQYSINGSTFQAGSSFTSVAAGSYTLYVKDVNACIKTLPITVSMLSSPSLTVTAAPSSCNASDGYITASGLGGTGILSFSKNGTLFQASNIFSGLAAGNYTITAKDTKGCLSAAVITVPQTGGPAITASSTDAVCNGSNGSLTIIPSGGTPLYTYSIDGINYFASNTFTGLSAGAYTAFVTDANLCTSTATVTIVTPPGTAGTWTGDISTDWFDCANWQAGIIPTNLIDVIIPATINSPVIDPSSVFAATYNGIAKAKNIIIDTDSLVFKPGASLDIAGNITVQNNARVNMTAGGTILLNGNWINTTGIAGFIAGSGNVILQGSTAQTVSTAGLKEIFNKLTVTHTGTGVTLLSDVTVNDSLIIVQGLLSAGIHTLDGNSLTMTGGTLRLAKINTMLPELNNYNLTGGTVEFNGADTQTIRPVNYYNLLSTAAGFRKLSSAGVTGVAALFIPGVNLYDVTGSAVDFNGTIAQDVPPVATNTPAPYSNQYNILLLSNGNNKTATGSFTILDSLKVNSSTTFSVAANIITLKSDSSQTARVGIVEGVIANAVAGGHYIAERFIPAHNPPKRAWRLLTAPVTGSRTINTEWQEGAAPSSSGATPPLSALNPDPQPGYGLHITGPGATANGFDESPLNNSSMKFYDSVNNTWNSITNTSAVLTSHEGYMTFVRGHRGYIISTTTANTTPLNTVLRSRGDVKTFTQTYSGTGFRVIGNPYLSSVNLHDVIRTGDAADAYYVWDPLIATAPLSSSGVGAYIPVLYIEGTGYVSAVDPNLPGPSQHPFDINGTIQSGEAFMVDFGTGGSLTINEKDKVYGSNTYAFRPNSNPLPQLRTVLYTAAADSSLAFLADGTLQLFDPSFMDEVNKSDVKKISNFSENLSVNSHGYTLSIETRSLLKRKDTVFYTMQQMRQRNYRLVIMASGLSTAGLHAFLEDNYTAQRIPVDLESETPVNFSVNANPASYAPGRFRMVFENTSATVLPLTITSVNAYRRQEEVLVNWTVENETNIAGYVLERSADGTHFSSIGSVPATAVNTVLKNYSLPDFIPVEGNNYYRIRAVALNGTAHYSRIVSVTIKRDTKFSILSNPVKGNRVTIKFSNVKKGLYQLRLLDITGKTIAVKQIKHAGGNSVESLGTNLFLPGGVYQLQIQGGDGKNVFDILHE